jgi:hypothetical protein
MPQVIETFQEFVIRQDCEYIITGTQISPKTGYNANRIVFANGAVSDRVTHFEPPSDRTTLLQVRREFLKTKLTREERDFREFKNRTISQASLHARFKDLPSGIDAESVEALRQGQTRVLRLREELAAVEQELTDPNQARHQQELMLTQAQQRNEHVSLLNKFQSIDI